MCDQVFCFDVGVVLETYDFHFSLSWFRQKMSITLGMRTTHTHIDVSEAWEHWTISLHGDTSKIQRSDNRYFEKEQIHDNRMSITNFCFGDLKCMFQFSFFVGQNMLNLTSEV